MFLEILRKSERGTIIILMAIFLPVALGIFALIINAGSLYYAKSIYTSLTNTATSSGISVLGDEIVDLVKEKEEDDPSFEATTPIWENLTDEDRLYLTTDSEIIEKVRDAIDDYLQKNLDAGTALRKNYTIKNISIIYPYHYDDHDDFVKARVELTVTSPIEFIANRKKQDVFITAESQLRIK